MTRKEVDAIFAKLLMMVGQVKSQNDYRVIGRSEETCVHTALDDVMKNMKLHREYWRGMADAEENHAP